MPGMVEQTNIMVRQVAKAAAKGGEFDLFEKITRAALVRVYTGQRTISFSVSLMRIPLTNTALGIATRTPSARYVLTTALARTDGG